MVQASLLALFGGVDREQRDTAAAARLAQEVLQSAQALLKPQQRSFVSVLVADRTFDLRDALKLAKKAPPLSPGHSAAWAKAERATAALAKGRRERRDETTEIPTSFGESGVRGRN